MEIWEENGSRYTGIFRNGKKWGRGCYEWPDGSYYEGDLVDSCFEGQGVYYFADQKKTYTGTFLNSNMNGLGTEVWQDGHTYGGQFVNGQKQGEGTMSYPNSFKQYKG